MLRRFTQNRVSIFPQIFCPMEQQPFAVVDAVLAGQ
jgi:hypothetical protein